MIIQENDFLRTYNEMTSLWEDTDSDATKVPVEIKGCIHEIETPFMTIPDFLAKGYCTSVIYVWKRLPYEDSKEPLYYVGKAKNIHRRTLDHIEARPRDSVALHAAIRKHKEATGNLSRFNIAILEFCTNDTLICNQKETKWIATLDTFENRDDFNLTPGGDGGNTRNKVTQEMYDEIVQHLKNTADGALTEEQLAREYQISAKTIRNINKGLHFRCPEENKNKRIRSTTDTTRVARAAEEAQYEKSKLSAAISQIVYKDTTENYYYFPTNMEAAEFAVMSGRYTTDLTTARNKIKKNAKPYEDLAAFKTTRITWGILNTVPNPADSWGGFQGDIITDEQGKELGIKIS